MIIFKLIIIIPLQLFDSPYQILNNLNNLYIRRNIVKS